MNGEAMLHALSHRGMDGQGQFREDHQHGAFFLGHRRLKIIDLSGNGQQPMHGAQAVMSYNGEVYNFKELKAEHLKGHQFKSDTDTEVILALYEKLGDDFVHHLNGAFAIAIYDKRQHQVKLFRDRLGIKPLYYHLTDDRLIFASEIKAILAAGVKPELNEEGISDFLVFKYSPGTNTLFKNIVRLAPGHSLTFDFASKRASINEFWRPTSAYGSYSLSFNSGMAELRDLVEDAVKIRLMSDVPVSNFLSGGLDSSIIAYYLTGKQDIKHFCAVKQVEHVKAEGTTPDGYHARKLAKEWGLDFNQIPIRSNSLTPEYLSMVMNHNEDLIADGSLIPSYLITREAAKSATVVLSGMGADEIFLGYGGHLMTLASMSMSRLPGTVERKMNEMMGALQPGLGSFKAYKRYLVKLGRYSAHRYKYFGFNVVGDVDSALSVYRSEHSSLDRMADRYFKSDTDVFESLSHFERENFLQKNLLYMDRMSMANGMEGRVPFLDHRIVEFAQSLPREFKLSNRFTTKHILKEAYRKNLPEHIVGRRKAGFGMPLRVLLSDSSKRKRLLDEDFFGSFSGFDIGNIRMAIDDHSSGRLDNSALIYALISFQSWYKMFIELDKEASVNLAV
jgi:asparagine synthase (glutamine-hydrolysing)